MKAIVDDKIPYIRPAIEALMDEVIYLPGKEIKAENVRDADVLIVRTRTRCDRSLLENSRVRFIATATIGFDHIDADYLRQAGIEWTNCPGCNANSVAQYIRNSLFVLSIEKGIDLSQATLGIVGVGHVGTAVLRAVTPHVGTILLNDPPLQEAREAGDAVWQSSPLAEYVAHDSALLQKEKLFASLDELTAKCDIITIHTPLINEGSHPTFHLMDATRLNSMCKGSTLLNAGRGEVVDNVALEAALDKGNIAHAIIDTWENEPNIRRTLLQKVFIGTPHIAGYSADGKANASRMSIEALCKWLGCENKVAILPPPLPHAIPHCADPRQEALAYYDPRTDSRRLKESPDAFERLRGEYPIRREN